MQFIFGLSLAGLGWALVSMFGLPRVVLSSDGALLVAALMVPVAIATLADIAVDAHTDNAPPDFGDD